MTTEDQAAVTGEAPSARALLVVPRLRVQNANTVSSPLTWGFPAITAFTGLMTALERRLGREAGLALHGVGVICHHFEPQVTRGGFVRSCSAETAAVATTTAIPAVRTPEIRRISAADRRQMVAEAAYLRGESKGFLSDEREDWLIAETEVDAMLAKANIQVGR